MNDALYSNLGIADETALNDGDLDALARIFEVLAQWDYEERMTRNIESAHDPAP